jgi:glutathione S-transferase
LRKNQEDDVTSHFSFLNVKAFVIIMEDTPIKLYYYKATGRANQIRLTLAAANIDFVDVHPASFPPTPEEKEGWRKLGGNTTTNIPMLQIGDKCYSQSLAVLKVAARLGGLVPSEANQEDAYITDKLIADSEDFRIEAYKSFVTWGATKEAADRFINEVVPLHFGNIERQLKEKGSDFFVGDKLTVADIAIYDAVINFGESRIPGDSLSEFAALKAWTKRVEASPGIAKYLLSEQYAGLMKFDESTLGY